MRRSRVRSVWHAVAVPGAVLLAWQVGGALGVIDPLFIPPPDETVQALVGLAGDGELALAAGTTTGRAVAGLAAATALAVPLGAVIGVGPWADRLSKPVLEFFRALPTVTVIPLIMLIIGVGHSLSVVAVVVGALWPILLNTVHGIRRVDRTLLDVAAVERLGAWQTMVKVRLRAALPFIVTGVRISLSIGLVIALVSEMLAGNGGLGSLVVEARSRFRSDEVFAIVAVMGLLGWLANWALLRFERRLVVVE